MMNKKTEHNNKGFTLIEIVIVVIILTIIATYAMTNYTRSLNKGTERLAITQLQSIHSANALYKSNANSYLSTGGTTWNRTAINNGFNINVVNRDLTMTYVSADGSAFTGTATLDSGAVLVVDEIPLGVNNPCCSAGTCLIVPNC